MHKTFFLVIYICVKSVRFFFNHNTNTKNVPTHSSKECLPYLLKSDHAHIINLSPPLNMNKIWFAHHVAYTMAKYGMSMCVLGMAEEFKGNGIGVNALWPRTAIHTAAIEMLTGPDSATFSRKPDIMADAAYEIMCKDPRTTSGNFFIDDEVLKSIDPSIDLANYACVRENADKLMPDFFLDMSPEDLAKWSDKVSGTAAAAAGASSEGAGQIAGLFQKIESKLSADLVGKVGAVYHFNVNGAEKGTWFLDLKNGSGRCGHGDSGNEPDATLTMDSKNFFYMFTGTILMVNFIRWFFVANIRNNYLQAN